MRAWRWFSTVAACGVLAGPATAQQAEHAGKPVYDKWCAGCHGVDGRGRGDAAPYMLPRPRDFTKALYQIRTTASGSLPTDADILRVINEGMPGSSMPGWEDQLSRGERENLVSYLKTFSRFFETDQPQVVEFGRAPGVSDERLVEGKEVYRRMECWRCHGDAGRGDGASAPTMADDDDFPIRPVDLTEGWYFNGGGSAEEIYRRFRTGLDGTPMPSYSDALAEGVVTDDELWSLAHYVKSMSGDAPRVREVVVARRIEGALPTSPADSAWAGAERFYVPLVAQIIVPPRWFAPSVDGVWIEALHNGDELAMRFSWSDPNDSPAPAWVEWRQRVAAVMEPHEDAAIAPAVPAASPEGAAGAADAGAADDGAAAGVPSGAGTLAGGWPDALAVWFPRTVPAGMQRPYFFMGSTRDPVYVWHWQSRGDAVTERQGRGPGQLDALSMSNGLEGSGEWEAGQWRVVFRRPLGAADSVNALTFTTGQPIPMALFAWDGDNTETGLRGSLSTWYFVQLEEPVPITTYATPILAVLLTAVLGVLAVGRAQKRERSGGTAHAAPFQLHPEPEGETR
ncbi:MAG TPA: c-type cytochrome [Longimicrobiales bacterium]|nr:c-type cytochrome [Longimicrobiales bacterium]